MPVGAGGDALGRIEAALAAEDPALVESFQRWGMSPEDPGDCGVTLVDRRTGLALLLGLLAVVAGPAGTLVVLLLGGILFACLVLLLGGILFACLVTARGVSPDSASPPAA